MLKVFEMMFLCRCNRQKNSVPNIDPKGESNRWSCPGASFPIRPRQCRSSHPGTPYGAPCKHLYPRNFKWRISSKLRQSKQHLPGLFPAKPKENQQNRGKQIFSASQITRAATAGFQKGRSSFRCLSAQAAGQFPFPLQVQPSPGRKEQGFPFPLYRLYFSLSASARFRSGSTMAV